MVSTAAISKKVRRALEKVGVTASLVDPGGVYSTSGAVTEGPVSTPVRCSPPVDESKRWLDPSITATLYIEAPTAVRARPGFRITLGDRTFVVIAAFPYSLKDAVLAWRLDVGEVA